jgi:hypothetical protein
MVIGYRLPTFFLSGLLALVLAGCTISTRKNSDQKAQNDDVDIRTPFGSLSVHSGNVDARETGLAPYPGAQLKKDSDGDGSANVNIASSIFGLKVVALKFQSDDPPDKVIGFYRKELGKYGKVVDCSGGFNMSFHHHDRDDPVSCDNTDTDHEYKQELKVGTENNQRIVAVRPNGKGSVFAMVYVRAHEQKDTM